MSMRISFEVLAWARTVTGNPKNPSPKLPSQRGHGGKSGSNCKSAWLWDLPLRHSHTVTLDKSLGIFKSAHSIEWSQLCLSPQGYCKDRVGQCMSKNFDCKARKPIKMLVLIYAILWRTQIRKASADPHPPGAP